MTPYRPTIQALIVARQMREKAKHLETLKGKAQ